MLPDSLVCTRGPKSRWSNPLVIALLVLAPSAANSQAPTFQDVTGHAFGERITVHHEMVRYLERLSETSDRVRLVDQGASWEGRRLLLAIVITLLQQPFAHSRSLRFGLPSPVHTTLSPFQSSR